MRSVCVCVCVINRVNPGGVQPGLQEDSMLLAGSEFPSVKPVTMAYAQTWQMLVTCQPKSENHKYGKVSNVNSVWVSVSRIMLKTEGGHVNNRKFGVLDANP